MLAVLPHLKYTSVPQNYWLLVKLWVCGKKLIWQQHECWQNTVNGVGCKSCHFHAQAEVSCIPGNHICLCPRGVVPCQHNTWLQLLDCNDHSFCCSQHNKYPSTVHMVPQATQFNRSPEISEASPEPRNFCLLNGCQTSNNTYNWGISAICSCAICKWKIKRMNLVSKSSGNICLFKLSPIWLHSSI